MTRPDFEWLKIHDNHAFFRASSEPYTLNDLLVKNFYSYYYFDGIIDNGRKGKLYDPEAVGGLDGFKARLQKFLDVNGGFYFDEFIYSDNFYILKYVFERGLLIVKFCFKAGFRILRSLYLEKSFLDSVELFFDNNFEAYSGHRENIFMLSSNGGEIKYESIGKASTEFNELNYSEQISNDYYKIIEKLNSNSSYGNLLLLEGEPGTGKTYFLRSLINKVKDAAFVYVQSADFSGLLSPSLLSPLKRLSLEYKKIVFVLEDADKILCERLDTSMDNINSILNFTSGIINEVFNIKVIASTNASKNSIDKAILRSGRLLEHLNFERLSEERAQKLFGVLVGDENVKYTGSTLLADIYAEKLNYLEGGDGFLTKNEEKKERVGFKL